MVLALFLRLWNLEDSLPFASDEGNNGILALQIMRGEKYPLRGVTPHFGALTHYITAGFFKVFGVSVFTARLVPALASVAAIALVYWWMVEWAGLRAAALAALLMIFSPWMISHARVTWEMAPNVFFVTLAAYAVHRYLKTTKLKWGLVAGLAVGAAANGHLYIVLLLLPFGLLLFLRRAALWRRVVVAVLLFLGAFLLLFPLLYESKRQGWDLLANYSTAAAHGSTFSWQFIVLDIIGAFAALLEGLGGPLVPAFLFALGWLTWRFIRHRNEQLTRFFFLTFLSILLLLPYFTGPSDDLGKLDRGWCGVVSRALGGEGCQPTHIRYFDILYPLPLVLVAWALSAISRRKRWLYLSLAVVLLGLLVKPAWAEISQKRWERIEHLRSAVRSLEDGACIVVHSAYRDFTRISTIAGARRKVFQLHEYPQHRQSCSLTYVISAYVPLRGVHLEHWQTVSVHGTALWYLYKLREPQIGDVLCPALYRTKKSGWSEAGEWETSQQAPGGYQCREKCKGSWQLVLPPHTSGKLHLLVSCAAFADEAHLLISWQGKKKEISCRRHPPLQPRSKWVATGIKLPAERGRVLRLTIEAENAEGADPLILKDVSACPNAPVDLEQVILRAPLGWI
jgi:hypothetical protein